MRTAQVIRELHTPSQLTVCILDRTETEEFVQLLLGAARQCDPIKEMNDIWQCLDIKENGDTNSTHLVRACRLIYL